MISDIRLLGLLHTCLHQIKSLTKADTPLHTYPFAPYGIIIEFIRDQTKKREEAEGWWIHSAGSSNSSEIRCCEKRQNIFDPPDADASFEHFDVFSLFALSHQRRDDATNIIHTLFLRKGFEVERHSLKLTRDTVHRIHKLVFDTNWTNCMRTCDVHVFTNHINAMATRSTHKSIDSGWLNI